MKKHETVSERKERLEAELKELELTALVEDRLNHIIDNVKDELKDYMTTSKVVGKEENPAANFNGDILYQYDCDTFYSNGILIDNGINWYGTYSMKTLEEKGIPENVRDLAKPYYRDVYTTFELTDEDIAPDGEYSYKHNDVMAMRKLISILESIEL